MLNTFLSLLLSAQLLCAGTPAANANPSAKITSLPWSVQESTEATPVFWGLLDPELSVWFTRIPGADEDKPRIIWDWSWRGFLAALFGRPLETEAIRNACDA